MNRYKDTFHVSAIIITALSILPFISGLLQRNLMQVLIFAGFPCLWIMAYNGLCRSRKGAFVFSWSLAILGWCGLLEQLIELRAFVIKNNGFERADGYGSPAAFWMYLVLEVMLFLLFSIVALHGLAVLLNRKRELSLGEEQDP